MASGSLSREQVLDELEFLATAEHALVIEYQSVSCALGHDLLAEEGGPTSDVGRDAANVASNLALGEMFRLKGVNRVLVKAERTAQLGRATSISGGSAGDIALGPPDLAQLRQLLERGHSIAAAIDQRYQRLRPAVTSNPVFDGDLLDEMRSIIAEDGPTHAEAFARLRKVFGDLAPAGFLRATRREAADTFEQRLLDISDRSYRLVLTALREQFAQDDFVSGSFRHLAVEAMEGLDDINSVLVSRGLLPPFTL